MRSPLPIVAAILVVSGCAKDSAPKMDQVDPKANLSFDACRDDLSSRICSMSRWPDSECAHATDTQKKLLISAISVSLPELRDIACRLDKIAIVDESSFLGRAEGQSIYINAALLKAGINDPLSYMSFIEQRFMTDGPKGLPIRDDYPRIEVGSQEIPENYFLSYVVTHELSHIYFMPIDGRLCNVFGDNECSKQLYEFTQLSWMPDQNKRDASTFELNTPLNFRPAVSPIDPADFPAAYAELKTSGFISFYSDKAMPEDLAETITMMWATKVMEMSPRITYNGEELYNFRDVIYSEAFAKKRNFVESHFTLKP